MLPDRVSNPGPLTYESGALPIALRGPAVSVEPEEFVPPKTEDSVQTVGRTGLFRDCSKCCNACLSPVWVHMNDVA